MKTVIRIAAFESRQLNDVFGDVSTPDPLMDAFAVASSDTPGTAFFADASVVDNGSNDPTFVAGR